MIETLITLAIIVALFAWPAFLQLICPPCSRLIRRYLPTNAAMDTAQSTIEKRTAA